MSKRPFLLYPIHEAVLQGKSKLTQSRLGKLNLGLILLVSLPFVVASVVLIAVTARGLYEEALLAGDSTIINGQVTNRTTYEDTSRRTDAEGYRDTYVSGYTYTLYYQYSFADRLYDGQQEVPEENYDAHQINQPISVIVANSQPTISRIDGIEREGTNRILVIFTSVWTLLVVIGVGTFYRAWARARRLERDGKLIEGEIVAYKGGKGADGKYHIALTLRFHSPDTGEWVEAKRSYPCSHHQNTRPPEVGTPLAVMYANKNVWEVL